MSGKSRFRLFSRNDSMSNTVVDAVGVVAPLLVVVVVAASTAAGRRGWTTAAGFWSPVTGGGGGGGRRRNICTFGGTAGADAVAVSKSSCEYVRTGSGKGCSRLQW